MLKASNLTIQYRQLLFKDLSFSLNPGDKVGLIGLNGSGKSTLLKIIAEIEQPDAGAIYLDKHKLGYLPQEYHFPDGLLVGEVLESLVDNPHQEMYKVEKLLGKLQFTDYDIYQEVSTLSHGQHMKLYLAKLLMAGADVLLLDEPTNYLDLPGILWVEEFIKRFAGICLIVSHDRTFLNAVTNKIFEIDEQRLYTYEGNYDAYLDQKSFDLAKRERQIILQERKRQKLEDLIDRIKKGTAGSEQAKALKAARSRLRREVLDQEVFVYREQKIKGLELKGQTHNSKVILDIRDLSFGYPHSDKLLDCANFTMYGKEKVWLYGANGIGKSTLIKLILGQLAASSGRIKIGDSLRWNYFSQDQSHLDPEATLEDYFLKYTNIGYTESFGVLERFLFSKDLRRVLIRNLSPGQRARLSFAIFAQKELDFLILDEPTNHLDIKSKEIIEESLRNYQGAMLLISHDRYFVDSVSVDRAVTIANKKLVEIFI
jgi:ATP-binding cassette subfamily F protein uup